MIEKIDDIRGASTSDYALYSRLAKSICPEIFSM